MKRSKNDTNQDAPITHVELPSGELYDLEDPWAKNGIWDSICGDDETQKRRKRDQRRRNLLERKGRRRS